MAEVKISPDQKREYIITVTAQMSREARKDILQWAVLNLPDESIREKPDGCRIDIGALSDERVGQLWSLIHHRLSS